MWFFFWSNMTLTESKSKVILNSEIIISPTLLHPKGSYAFDLNNFFYSYPQMSVSSVRHINNRIFLPIKISSTRRTTLWSWMDNRTLATAKKGDGTSRSNCQEWTYLLHASLFKEKLRYNCSKRQNEGKLLENEMWKNFSIDYNFF